jgi:hypothetical protein
LEDKLKELQQKLEKLMNQDKPQNHDELWSFSPEIILTICALRLDLCQFRLVILLSRKRQERT